MYVGMAVVFVHLSTSIGKGIYTGVYIRVATVH